MTEIGDIAAPAASRPNPAYLVRCINRLRQGLRRRDPVDLDFDVSILHSYNVQF